MWLMLQLHQMYGSKTFLREPGMQKFKTVAAELSCRGFVS